MAGKKWCQYCRLNISYSKKDIQQHEQTRLHLQNKQRTIKFERIKKQQDQKKQHQINKQNALLSSANIPKAKKGSNLQKQVQDYRESVIAGGKAAIHQLIAQRTHGLYGAPIQFPEKEDLILAQNFKNKKQENSNNEEGSEESEQFQMWRIDICEQTGDPCFINNVTQAKYYEPPRGYVMNEKQKEEWQYLRQICQQKVDVNADNTVNITEWEEVPDQQNYFNVNAIKQDDQSEEENQQQNKLKRPISSLYGGGSSVNKGKQQLRVEKKTWKDQLEAQLNNNSIDSNQVMETVIAHQLQRCKNLKQKNQTLKNLIKGGIEIRQTSEDFNKKEPLLQQKNHEVVGFKPKKKIKTSKLMQQSDMY